MKALHALVFSLLLAVGGPVLAADRTLELKLDGAAPVRVHNLVGSVRLVPGDGELVIRARVRADKRDIADAIQLRRDNGRDGVEIVVEYPQNVSRVRYDGEEFRRLDVRLDYQDRKMRVTSSGGEPVRVDLEILVPADRVVEVRQGVGAIDAKDLQARLALTTRYGAVQVADSTGRLAVTTGSGRVGITGFRGDVTTTTGSGPASLENILGRVQAKTGSGGVTLRGIDGDVVAETGSGNVRINDMTGSLKSRTGSGSVRVENLAAGPELDITTGSGSVAVSGDLASLRQVAVRTGSGSVSVESATPLSLAVELKTGSGGFRVDAPALSNVESDRRSFSAVIGAGEGNARLVTGSGSIRISAP
ncbi:MAG: DUF4097 family beta strand repeat-containing protein [Gammaproteobacteria bacterium]